MTKKNAQGYSLKYIDTTDEKLISWYAPVDAVLLLITLQIPCHSEQEIRTNGSLKR